MIPPDLNAVHSSHNTTSPTTVQTPRQLDLLDYGRNAAETRAIAAAAAMEQGPSRRDQIGAYVASCGRFGGTRQEIADSLKLPIQSVCGPVLAMLRSGRLIETNRRRTARHGKSAAVIVCPEHKGGQ